MKKILIAGIAVLFAMFVVTCEEWLPVDDDDAVIEYTDVEYLSGGSQVKVWIDGSKPVPVTKRSQRAMSTDLSKMAYDFLEVIFVSGTTYARSQWELGQSAGISGIVRAPNDTATAPDYIWSAGKLDNYALMAVGTKDNKTLLGVGAIGSVDGGTYPATAVVIKPSTQYVTFYLTSVKSGLLVSGESVGGPSAGTNPVGATFSSFPGTGGLAGGSSSRTSLGDSQYPMYNFASAATTATATYTFDGAVDTYNDDLIFSRSAAPFATAERRIPRYLYSGRYMIAKGLVNTQTKVDIASSYVAASKKAVPLTFTISGKGIFSFFIDIPVYLKTSTVGTNGGTLKPVPWHIRSGFGSELYSLDDGAGSGGCVLMGIGFTSIDWLDITWEWL